MTAAADLLRPARPADPAFRAARGYREAGRCPDEAWASLSGDLVMQAWFDFYAVIGAAAATLTGLLFVAMSMNAPAALSRGPEGSRRLAEQAFENYLAVLMVSLLALFPDMSLLLFGRITL